MSEKAATSQAARPASAAPLSFGTTYVLIFLIVLGIVVIFPTIRYPFVVGPGKPLPPPALETFAALLVMTYSVFAIVWFARERTQELRGTLAAYTITFTIAAAALWLVPQWSGVVAVGALGALIYAPNWLLALSYRSSVAGARHTAALYAQLASRLHPSRAMRRYAGLLQAAALPSVDAQVAAYDALKPGATAVESTAVDCVIAMTRDDWASALGHSCGDPSLARCELRALGELGRVEEMIAALARLQPTPHGRELDYYRLIMLAFTGRADGVRALLRRRLRFLRPERAAYWSFIAANEAGIADGSRDALAHQADVSDNETFRLAARRHLAAPRPATCPPHLSAQASAIIAEFEAAVGRPTR